VLGEKKNGYPTPYRDEGTRANWSLREKKKKWKQSSRLGERKGGGGKTVVATNELPKTPTFIKGGRNLKKKKNSHVTVRVR